MNRSRIQRVIAPLIAAFGLALIAGDCDDCDFDDCDGTRAAGVEVVGAVESLAVLPDRAR